MIYSAPTNSADCTQMFHKCNFCYLFIIFWYFKYF